MSDQNEPAPQDERFPRNERAIPIAEAGINLEIKIEDMAQDPGIPVATTSEILPEMKSSSGEALHSRQVADLEEEEEVALMLFSLSRGVSQTKQAKPAIRSSSHHDLSSLQLVS